MAAIATMIWKSILLFMIDVAPASLRARAKTNQNKVMVAIMAEMA